MARQQYPHDSNVVHIIDDISYAYVHRSAQQSKPTFLLLHGFPSSSYDWRHQIVDLSAAGYGILAPDLLGYGDTSKPEAKEEYALHKMSGHIAKLLDSVSLTKVIGVGHDWGSGLLADFANRHQHYLTAAVFVATPYFPPAPIDLNAINQMTEQAFGYPCYGYQEFLIAPESAQKIQEHHESFHTLMYPANPEVWKTDFGPIGKTREWIESNRRTSRPNWLSEAESAIHSSIMLRGGYTGPLNWYKSAVRDIGSPNFTELPAPNRILHVPVLLIAAQLDYGSRPEMVFHSASQGQKEGYLPNVEVKQVKTGHWVQLEAPRELSDILENFANTAVEVRLST